METAEHDSSSNLNTAVHSLSFASGDRTLAYADANRRLVEEIDELRKTMTEAFLREESFTSDSVIEISRLLDTKIIEYMRLITVNR
ncbi:hypothetical protein J19TS2_34710 [Cohnella xylanilytica]|uniref:Aspartyl-phosphate phosphatase Spo0E family protein n=1 Tax=Cohnella xylanilytica TaxID=557555 RepID=A0A841U0P3_9BACL|nr:aspartyl-phosphate phosphatase Spo0E family protein [Cohnella xylanilytica]MBB6691691.1 aspartyl-phosphate phosphatase Spo0E family protein [Cohnella xylanilytica]GIO13916.1 hypothetical protein J19TS2_34710 [Cohnella xylanilytica]